MSDRETVAMALWRSSYLAALEDEEYQQSRNKYLTLADAALAAMGERDVTVSEAARVLVLIGPPYNSPLLEALNPHRNDVEIHEDVLKALRALAEKEPTP